MKFFFLARYVKNRKTWAHTAPTKIYANIAYFGLNEISISLNIFVRNIRCLQQGSALISIYHDVIKPNSRAFNFTQP